MNNYVAIIKQIEDEIFSYIDEFEDKDFIFSGDTATFKFKTDDNLLYNEKINIPVCVKLLSSVIKKDWIDFSVFKLQTFLYENFS